jgi:hypothetical protein
MIGTGIGLLQSLWTSCFWKLNHIGQRGCSKSASHLQADLEVHQRNLIRWMLMCHFLLYGFVQLALLLESSFLRGMAMLTVQFYGMLVNDYHMTNT